MTAPQANSHAPPRYQRSLLARWLSCSDARLWTWVWFLSLLLLVASFGCSSTLTTAPFCRALHHTVCPCPPEPDQVGFNFDDPSPLAWSEPTPTVAPTLYSTAPTFDLNSVAPNYDIEFTSQAVPLHVLPNPFSNAD
jgi:hypothetical protein